MSEFWTAFMQYFCAVEFACSAGQPNWLGWLILAVGFLFVLGIVGNIVMDVLERSR